jgi:hypothetical protein
MSYENLQYKFFVFVKRSNLNLLAGIHRVVMLKLVPGLNFKDDYKILYFLVGHVKILLIYYLYLDLFCNNGLSYIIPISAYLLNF